MGGSRSAGVGGGARVSRHAADRAPGQPFGCGRRRTRVEVVRHELAHLALHEYLGDLAPRWFDEGYASYSAHELTRNDALAANLALALEGVPNSRQLEGFFSQGATTARAGYALAASAVAAMSALDPQHGLARVFAALAGDAGRSTWRYARPTGSRSTDSSQIGERGRGAGTGHWR